jgi:xylulokinase
MRILDIHFFIKSLPLRALVRFPDNTRPVFVDKKDGSDMAKFLIGCDIGTSGAKAIITDEEGTILGDHYVEYPLHSRKANWFEHDANDYWKVFKANIAAILHQSKADPREVVGVSVSACSPCCVMVDRNGNALKYCPTWMDRRAIAECDYVRELYGDEEIFRISANPLDPHSGAIKLLWKKTTVRRSTVTLIKCSIPRTSSP